MCEELLNQLRGNSDHGLQLFCGHYQHVLLSCQARNPRHLEMLCIHLFRVHVFLPNFVSSRAALNASTIIISLNPFETSEVTDAERVEHIEPGVQLWSAYSRLRRLCLQRYRLGAGSFDGWFSPILEWLSTRNDEFYGSRGAPLLRHNLGSLSELFTTVDWSSLMVRGTERLHHFVASMSCFFS